MFEIFAYVHQLFLLFSFSISCRGQGAKLQTNLFADPEIFQEIRKIRRCINWARGLANPYLAQKVPGARNGADIKAQGY